MWLHNFLVFFYCANNRKYVTIVYQYKCQLYSNYIHCTYIHIHTHTHTQNSHTKRDPTEIPQ